MPIRSEPPPPKSPHVSVLLAETREHFEPRPTRVIVDATLGAGGHTEALLREGATVIGVDRDAVALELAKARLEGFGDRFIPLAGPFSALKELLAARGIRRVSGLLADVGVSSMQIDDPARGMSFRQEGPLDMRMDRTTGQTARELIFESSDEELANLIYRLGEERRSRRVARCIKQAEANGELETTLDLRRAIIRAVGPARVGGVDPATRTFQALRIAVNGELDELSALLSIAADILEGDGVLGIISFHSLEDRIVKRALQDREIWAPVTKKPIVPTDEECAENPRARSAKFRVARRRPLEDVAVER